MNYLKKKHLSRRALLRGAGAAVSLPLLESMIPAAASAQAAAVRRPRLACLYVPHGAVMDLWTPASDGALELSPTLQAFAPVRDKVNVVSGLELPLAYGTDASAGANHTRSSAVYLTAAEPGTGGEARIATSMDQLAAQHIGQDTPLPSLELSIEEGGLSCGAGLSCAYRNTISWASPVSPLPMENNPQIVFERLFGDGATDAERAARRAQAQSLLDSVMEDVAALKRDLPATDKVRMDRYLEDVREVERRVILAGQQIPEGLEIPPAPTGIPNDFETHIAMMIDLMVLAWQAEITRVSTLMLAKEVSNATFPASGINEPFHNLSHHSNVPDNIARLSKVNAYHAAKAAYLVQRLNDTLDGEVTLLDNALVMYGSGMSNSNMHNHDPLPILLAGGACGKLQGGRHLRANGQPLSNLLLAMLHKMDVPAESFGDSTGVTEI